MGTISSGETATSSWANATQKKVACALIPVIAQGSDDEIPVFRATHACEIVALGIIVETAITGADTNYFTLGFKDKGSDGSASNVIASKAFTSGVNASAFDYTDFGTPDSTHKVLAEDDVVSFYKTETGTGMATPRLLAVIEYENTP